MTSRQRQPLTPGTRPGTWADRLFVRKTLMLVVALLALSACGTTTGGNGSPTATTTQATSTATTPPTTPPTTQPTEATTP